MLLKDYVKSKQGTVSFIYCYLGKGSEYLIDERLSFMGPADEVAAFIENDNILKNLYAGCGECNDFEETIEADVCCLKFIDFR